MLQALLYALPLGITLSFAVGPVFFVLIETSISAGRLKALTLDLGAISADVIFILLAFYGSQSIVYFLENNAWIGVLSGCGVVGFGVYYIRKSTFSAQITDRPQLPKKRLYFFKGFLLNFMNVGVFFYWVATTLAISPLLDNRPDHMWVFYASAILSYLFVDGFKIYFAHRFKEKLLQQGSLQKTEKGIGVILILFGLYIIVSNLI